MRRAGPQTSSKQSPRGTGATLFRFDQDLQSPQRGARPFHLVGIDEAGRGPWADAQVPADSPEAFSLATRRELGRSLVVATGRTDRGL